MSLSNVNASRILISRQLRWNPLILNTGNRVDWAGVSGRLKLAYLG